MIYWKTASSDKDLTTSRESPSSSSEISIITIRGNQAGTMKDKGKGLETRIAAPLKDGKNIQEKENQGLNETGITAGTGIAIDTGIMKG